MRKKLKVIGFITGLAILFFILQYDFSEDDSWNAWNLPLSGKVILLDPGHGGPDGGADNGNVLEKDISLEVSLKLRDYLQEQGAVVMMTREDDRDLAAEDTKGYSRRKVEDLKKRLNMINHSDADFYVSVHLNSIPSPKWRGAQTFFASHIDGNARAAKFIQDELIANLENTTRRAKELKNVYILDHSKKPGVLVEVGFLSNQNERTLLQSDDYQNKIAASIYNGIMRHYSNEKEIVIED
ncbi:MULTISPECIES: N-acetylmuramoyl-L-alanine amidase CwlD [Cytobacillus]|uniref:N-acetylmuramoyl-L-alanine amidase CwlD n=1 Tax=Cytobacillus stercorigallinarum TaxID=2762240 RepID=A0ABR8QV67_9BACI|nr:N-acetylmuramoyl-L-alanine amidase CwlD [Cytobacillus stercorigallinarum]MBD7939157.1 N-acetylmuramoyl-L-alanine amidase CwlD [Cytobacillus stercorigallinarum]